MGSFAKQRPEGRAEHHCASEFSPSTMDFVIDNVGLEIYPNTMKKIICFFILLSLFSALCGCSSVDKCTERQTCESRYDVAAIVWSAYHPEPRWKELGIFGDGKGEWQNVYEAKPKFKGHNQPLVPLWG